MKIEKIFIKKPRLDIPNLSITLVYSFPKNDSHDTTGTFRAHPTLVEPAKINGTIHATVTGELVEQQPKIWTYAYFKLYRDSMFIEATGNAPSAFIDALKEWLQNNINTEHRQIAICEAHERRIQYQEEDIQRIITQAEEAKELLNTYKQDYNISQMTYRFNKRKEKSNDN